MASPESRGENKLPDLMLVCKVLHILPQMLKPLSPVGCCYIKMKQEHLKI